MLLIYHYKNYSFADGADMTYLWTITFFKLIPGSSIGFIKTSASSRTVPEGSSVSLSCELSNSSIPVKLWMMMMSGAMYTPRKNVVNYGQVFILHRVTRKMAGTYLCRVTRPRLNKNLGIIWVTERQRGSANRF